jgi:hypothetical protein
MAARTDAFFDAAVDVALAEGFTGGAEDDHFIGLRRQCGFEALHVWHEHAVAHARLALQSRHHGGVVAHLRHPFRRDEAGDFDLAQARGRQALDELDLVHRVDVLLLVLQTVSRADIDQRDLWGQ